MYHYSTALFGEKHPFGFMKSCVIAGMLIIFFGPIHAMDIYRWVDDAGQTHMSDRVPEKYKAAAKRIDSKKFDISEADRKQAQDRAAKDKLATERPPADAVEQPEAVNVSKPTAPSPQSTCAQKWDAYYESQECFGPFKVPTPFGSKISPEGFAKCQIVESPLKTCEYDKRLSHN